MTSTRGIIDANQAFYRAFERKDIDAMGMIWSKGAASLCVHPGRHALRGWEQIRESWETIFKNTEYLEIDIELVTVEVNGGLGYVVLVEHLFQVVRGRRLEAQSVATNLFEQMSDRWYIVHHHGSPVA
ncbi:MAG: nuclear transport factor 2 family protein [Elainellaceae cyanobacterium]